MTLTGSSSPGGRYFFADPPAEPAPAPANLRYANSVWSRSARRAAAMPN